MCASLSFDSDRNSVDTSASSVWFSLIINAMPTGRVPTWNPLQNLGAGVSAIDTIYTFPVPLQATQRLALGTSPSETLALKVPVPSHSAHLTPVFSHFRH